MKGDPRSMNVLTAATAEEALKLYARRPDAQPLAGGTDFMVVWNTGVLNGKTVLDISSVKEWTGIGNAKDGSLRVGALTTHAELRDHPVVRKEFRLLSDACALIGAEAIQNRGTLGGNIANASPAGDTFPPLAVYEAVVHVAGPAGRRPVPFSEIFKGVKKTTLAPSELIEAVHIPFPSPRPSRTFFRKVGTRAAQALSKVVAAGLLWLEKDGSVKELRFAVGSVAPTVRRLKAVEDFVRGRKLDAETIRRAYELAAWDISPIDDVRSTAAYRQQISKNLLRSFLEPRP